MATVDKRGVHIEYVSLAELRRWPRNPKGHALGTLHESYDRFGYVMPMLLDERTGKLAVGHGRLDALQQRKAAGRQAPGGIRASDGAWSVPVVRGVFFENDAEMDAYIIADNRLTELGGWDEPGLAAILADLAVEEEGLRGIGYDKDDLDALLASLASEPVTDPGAETIPEQYTVIVECKSEAQQVEVLELLAGGGYQCRKGQAS